MATTDARTGFRLPWNSDQRPQSDDPNGTGDRASPAEAWSGTEPAESAETTSAEDHAPADEPRHEAFEPAPEAPMSVVTNAPPRPRPSKFLAELTKAMQAAAETARAETLERFQADAKSHVEQIHARSADEAAAIRSAADDDVGGIREWSKAEIARIRDETERRIADRKTQLEHEIEAHAARIERRIERVQSTLETFEAEMAAFFSRLMAEEDPSNFASMAEQLPEPATLAFGDDNHPVAATRFPAPEPIVEAPVSAPEPDAVVEPALVAEAVAETAESVDETPAVVEVEAHERPEEVAIVDQFQPDATVETVDAVETAPEAAPVDDVPHDTVAPEMADATVAETAADPVAPDQPTETADEPAAEAWAEAWAEAETLAAEPVTAEAQEAGAPEAEASAAEAPASEPVPAEPVEADPRLAALALTPDTTATDGAFAESDLATAEVEEIPTIADDALAARLAGLVAGEDDQAPVETTTTRVVVTGLVSVASIASFKRHLGRLEAVQAVGVTSGPEGEFVFTVTHGRDLAVRDSIPTLPGFQARVTGSEDGVVHVSAHDPESEA